MDGLLVAFVFTAILLAFLNGFHDSSNVVATMISSRALSPRQALTITAIAEFLAPFLFGVAVAETIGQDVLAPEALTIPVVFSAILSAVVWNVITWYFGVPSSTSHALIGGMVGGGLAEAFTVRIAHGDMFDLNDLYDAFGVVRETGIVKVLVALLVSPAAGFLAGFALMRLIRFFARGAGPGINRLFKRGQVLTALSLALSHGTNDAQKTMGIITMGLLAGGVIPEFRVPLWVVAASATAIALGTATGGWRLIRTLGAGFYKIRPVHGLTTQVSSAGVILVASLLGGPVSTTQVVSTAIMGAGSAERFSKVRWGVSKQIALTWVVTIPATAVVAALFFLVLQRWQ